MTTLTPKDMEDVIELRKLMRGVLDIEPGDHPEIPEMVHKVMRSMLTTLVYVLNLAEETHHEFVQHRLDQELNDMALHKVFNDLRVFGPDTYQQALIKVTEEIGGRDVGQA